jgi:hypothetical protein
LFMALFACYTVRLDCVLAEDASIWTWNYALCSKLDQETRAQ